MKDKQIKGISVLDSMIYRPKIYLPVNSYGIEHGYPLYLFFIIHHKTLLYIDKQDGDKTDKYPRKLFYSYLFFKNQRTNRSRDRNADNALER